MRAGRIEESKQWVREQGGSRRGNSEHLFKQHTRCEPGNSFCSKYTSYECNSFFYLQISHHPESSFCPNVAKSTLFCPVELSP